MESDVKFAVKSKKILGENGKVVVVGTPTSLYAEKILKENTIDIVARKEIDFTLPEIASAIEGKMKLEDVLGISFVRDGKIINNSDRPFLSSEDLDKLPFVSQVYKRHLNIKDYQLDNCIYPTVIILTSRGCPNLCTFCSWPENLTGRIFRARSAKNIADEIEWIINNIPEVKEIRFDDDAFTINKSRVLEFVEEVKKRKLKFTWSCQTRATLDFETMKAMKSAGCRLLDVGFESGSDMILKNIKKGITVKQARKFAVNAKKAGLMIHADFVFGFPGENKETIEQTKRFIKEIKPHTLQIAIASPIPGTEFYKEVQQKGYLLEEDMSKSITKEGYQKTIISYPWLSDKDIQKARANALKNYYISASYIPVAMDKIIRKNGIYELIGIINSVKYFFKFLRSERLKNCKK